jgi:mannose/fructose/N-acetylgalactosamine-specific phosphotransferase system component IID
MVEDNPSVSKKIMNCVEWLLNQQLADGSWSSNHILRIPHPSMMEPWKQPFWNQDGKAINAAIQDHRRLFTTATVFAALSDFRGKSFLKGELR